MGSDNLCPKRKNSAYGEMIWVLPSIPRLVFSLNSKVCFFHCIVDAGLKIF